MENIVALRRLIAADWTAPCRTTCFCFGCASPVCVHCCEPQGHRAAHHPHEAGHPLLIETITGRLAVDATNAVGCGYDLTRIHRIVYGGRKYILILPMDHDDLRHRSFCDGCGRPIKGGATLYCSLSCKSAIAQGGARRHVAQRLVALAAQGQFGQLGPELHFKDRFCMLCRLAYCSASCPDHLTHHHPNAAPEVVKIVVRFEGWTAIPQGQLPDAWTQDVQALQHPDGPLFPLHRRPHPLPPPAIGVGAPHVCDGADCGEIIFGLDRFCSLRCRHQAAA